MYYCYALLFRFLQDTLYRLQNLKQTSRQIIGFVLSLKRLMFFLLVLRI